MFCPNCGTEKTEGNKFCANCGFNFSSNKGSSGASENTYAYSNVQHSKPDYDNSYTSNTGYSRSNNGFAQSVKNDFSNSATINYVKERASEVTQKSKNMSKKTITILAVVASVVLLTIILVCNIHKCYDCEEIFFGSGHKVYSYDSGKKEWYCNDCYDPEEVALAEGLRGLFGFDD